MRSCGSRLERTEIGEWFGAPVTSVARTVVDVARASGTGPAGWWRTRRSPRSSPRWVICGSGRFRVDFLWPGPRVIVEVDGRLKYEGTDKRRLWKEKLRQEALERVGFRVVRLIWSEV